MVLGAAVYRFVTSHGPRRAWRKCGMSQWKFGVDTSAAGRIMQPTMLGVSPETGSVIKSRRAHRPEPVAANFPRTAQPNRVHSVPLKHQQPSYEQPR